ncbi:hypothetical protein VHP8226_01177 [Vibrio hippocampi]|uniref:Uncharacterized protein n=1 Tax=Vibrio hippocampi TaxID=654686 RepID=A0ABM8ZGZ1_9VIBR|nr:hypothetical protein VHP8226_01177 [Vibrio hippocampi]
MKKIQTVKSHVEQPVFGLLERISIVSLLIVATLFTLS